MKRDVLNVLKCTAEGSRQQVVVALQGFCEEGKGSKCFSGGPIEDTARSWVLLAQSIGGLEKQASSLARDNLRGVPGSLGMPASSCAWC